MRYNMTREQMKDELSKSFRDRLFETTFAKSGRVADVEHLNAFRKFVGEKGAAPADELEDEIRNTYIMDKVRSDYPGEYERNENIDDVNRGVMDSFDEHENSAIDAMWDEGQNDFSVEDYVDSANGTIGPISAEAVDDQYGGYKVNPVMGQVGHPLTSGIKVIQPTAKSSVEKTNYGDAPTTRPNGTPEAAIGAHREKQMMSSARRRADEKKDERQQGRSETPNSATNAIGANKPRTSDLKGLTSKGRDAAREMGTGYATTDELDFEGGE